MDAFHTADRRQRGHLPYDRVFEIYSLYFHASVGQLENEELVSLVEKCMHHSSDGALVVDYARLAEALRKRDFEQMTKAEARALRQSGIPQSFSPERAAAATGAPPLTHMPTSGVAAALRMETGETGAFGGVPHRQPFAPQQAHSPGLLPRTGRGGADAPMPPPHQHLATSPNRMMPPPHGDAEATSPFGRVHGGGGGMFGGYDGHGTDAPHRPPMSASRSPAHAQDPSGAVPGEGVLNDLLIACELADDDRSGRLHGAQLMTCCRMRGVEESSALLRAMMADAEGIDGRVDYVKFVQQIAAQRAGTGARERIARRHQAAAAAEAAA